MCLFLYELGMMCRLNYCQSLPKAPRTNKGCSGRASEEDRPEFRIDAASFQDNMGVVNT